MLIRCRIPVIALLLAGCTGGGSATGSGGGTTNGRDRHGSVFVDPLGLLIFGPRFGVEAGGSHFTGAVVGCGSTRHCSRMRCS